MVRAGEEKQLLSKARARFGRQCMLCLVVLVGFLALVWADPCYAAPRKHTHHHKTALKKTERHVGMTKAHSKDRHAHSRSGKMAKRVGKAKHTYAEGRNAKKHRHATLIARHPRHLKNPRIETAGVPMNAVDQGLSDAPSMEHWLAKARHDDNAMNMNDKPLGERTLKILDSAQSYLGTPYRFGGTTPEGFDCSGFVRHVFGQNGVSLSRTSREQFQQGQAIPISAARPGDLIFFGSVKRKHCRIDHVGVYIGEGRIIHAASSRSGQVQVSELKPPQKSSRVILARRILEDAPERSPDREFEPQE